ncbi:hypothetical protein [Mycolicibacterium neoaurum]|uniref:hypothetical protein n=1 Tax=Mycolicibacterium neoaurum TaxID=1795 RepID=UPI001F4D0921|nr:hypothetical protein [Mycolicibacterium neoaurum]
MTRATYPANSAPDLHRGEKQTLILVAIIGALAALLGSSVGGFFTSKAVESQIGAELSHQVRDDKKSAYLRYFEARAAIRDSEFLLIGNLVKPELPPADWLDQKIDVFSDAVRKVHDAESGLKLMGSSEVNDAALKSAEVHYQIQKKIHDAAAGVYSTDERIAVIQEAQSLRADAIRADDAVYEVARRDLGF